MKDKRIRVAIAALAFALVPAIIFGFIVKFQSSKRITTSSTTSTTLASTTTQPSTSSTTVSTVPNASIVQFNGRVVNVLNFGADPTGVKDSRAAIDSALLSAEKEPGSELFFPPGTYILTSTTTKVGDFVVTTPIRIVGAGTSATKIINEVGLKTGSSSAPPVFVIKGGGSPTPSMASGTLVESLTIDCSTYISGTAVMDFADNTAIENLLVYAPKSTDNYNTDQFGVRVIAICNHSNYQTIYRTGNLVQNVSIISGGSVGNTGLDISCQLNTNVSNVTIQGNGLDVYFSRNVNLTNLRLTSGLNGEQGYFTWVVVGSHNINLSNIVTVGNGGEITPATKSLSTDITLDNEVMMSKTKDIYIGDADGVKIINSQLGGVAFTPSIRTSNVQFVGSSYSGVRCPLASKVNNLSGIACG
ncbi:MAG: glycosyl hydrolase family 28-related protein [Actinomycetota bacterium]|nr:glycosyl hydrolase family 28-related protein [Actinomycetota bacterium]